jgi:transcription termination factor NusB
MSETPAKADVKKSSSGNMSLQKKSAARMAAVQCLYTRLMSDVPLTPARQLSALKKRLANNVGEQKLIIGRAVEPNYGMVEAILGGMDDFGADIDSRIDSVLNASWTRERMSPVLISILQAGVFELFFYKSAQSKIIIDEYCQVTARFFGEAEVNFVHGALSSLVQRFHG